MADVEISYNGDTIVSMSDSGTEYLDTKGKFMTDNITVSYEKSGGVTITLSQMGASFNLRLPVVATTDVDPDSPWITYIRNLPANSLIVGLSAINASPVCSTGITYVSSSFGSRPTTYLFAFSVGDSDGTINI